MIETAPSPVVVAPSVAAAPARNIAVDAYRGFVMLLMMGEVLELARVAAFYPGNWFWGVLAFNQTHVEWAGCSLHDMIQPSFSFLVGVAMPYSLARRMQKGGRFGNMFAHALWRSFILVALGIFLRSMHSTQTYFTFEDTLSQIGLGYPFLFLLGFCKPRWQWIAFGVIVVGYWAAWALYPVPGPGFDWTTVGVPAGWQHNFTGFAAHWNKNMNLGNSFDQWFLNLFPRTKPFVYNGGGYLTLSFIPTLGTMILGLIAGGWVKNMPPAAAVKRFALVGLALAVTGLALHFAGIAPIVKRIWTPGWTLFSGGICFLFLAAFTWVIEVRGYRKWAFPLMVIGLNSIAAYLIAHLFQNFIESSLHIHFGAHPLGMFGPAMELLLTGIVLLTCYWLLLFWMYRRKIFLRI